MVNQDEIEHLLDVERQAAELLSDAQNEYDKRLESYRIKADSQYKDAYEQLIREQEARYEQAVSRADAEHKAAFDAYCADVQSWHQDKTAFASVLEPLLFNR